MNANDMLQDKIRTFFQEMVVYKDPIQNKFLSLIHILVSVRYTYILLALIMSVEVPTGRKSGKSGDLQRTGKGWLLKWEKVKVWIV